MVFFKTHCFTVVKFTLSLFFVSGEVLFLGFLTRAHTEFYNKCLIIFVLFLILVLYYLWFFSLLVMTNNVFGGGFYLSFLKRDHLLVWLFFTFFPQRHSHSIFIISFSSKLSRRIIILCDWGLLQGPFYFASWSFGEREMGLHGAETLGTMKILLVDFSPSLFVAYFIFSFVMLVFDYRKFPCGNCLIKEIAGNNREMVGGW